MSTTVVGVVRASVISVAPRKRSPVDDFFGVEVGLETYPESPSRVGLTFAEGSSDTRTVTVLFDLDRMPIVVQLLIRAWNTAKGVASDGPAPDGSYFRHANYDLVLEDLRATTAELHAAQAALKEACAELSEERTTYQERLKGEMAQLGEVLQGRVDAESRAEAIGITLLAERVNLEAARAELFKVREERNSYRDDLSKLINEVHAAIDTTGLQSKTVVERVVALAVQRNNLATDLGTAGATIHTQASELKQLRQGRVDAERIHGLTLEEAKAQRDELAEVRAKLLEAFPACTDESTLWLATKAWQKLHASNIHASDKVRRLLREVLAAGGDDTDPTTPLEAAVKVRAMAGEMREALTKAEVELADAKDGSQVGKLREQLRETANNASQYLASLDVITQAHARIHASATEAAVYSGLIPGPTSPAAASPEAAVMVLCKAMGAIRFHAASTVVGSGIFSEQGSILEAVSAMAHNLRADDEDEDEDEDDDEDIDDLRDQLRGVAASYEQVVADRDSLLIQMRRLRLAVAALSGLAEEPGPASGGADAAIAGATGAVDRLSNAVAKAGHGIAMAVNSVASAANAAGQDDVMGPIRTGLGSLG